MTGGDFEDVFEDLFVETFHVANRILGNRNDAEDVAAETMARVLDGWWLVRRMRSPRGWAVRVASNLAIDVIRRRRFLAQGNVEHAAHADDDIDGRLALCDLFRHLPPRQREVLTLRYVVDLSETDIATLLGISTGSVKQHASRALDRLRRHDKEGVTQIAV